MIDIKDYHNAIHIVKQYELEQREKNIKPNIVIKDNIPNDFWYSNMVGKLFYVQELNTSLENYTELDEFKMEDFYQVLDNGEYKNCAILKIHTLKIKE
jgi:hypothetical protein